MSVASPAFNFFRDAAKPLKVKGVVLDRTLNVDNFTRQELLGNREGSPLSLNGVLLWGGTGATSTSFVVQGTPAASTTMVGGVAYVDGRRFVVPKEVLSPLSAVSPNFIYINQNGRYAFSVATPPSTPHCPVVVIDNSFNPPESGTSHYSRVWGNGFEGNGIYFGFDFDPLDFTNPGVARTFTIGGALSFSGNVDITGDLIVRGDLIQYDTTFLLDNFIVGDHDGILLGGTGTPTGDFGFQWSHSTAGYGTAILGLSPDNQRMIIAEDTDFTATDAATFDAIQTDIALHASFVTPNTTVPDIILTDGALTATAHLALTYARIVAGSTSGANTYALEIDTTQNTAKDLHITSGQEVLIRAASASNIQLTTAGGGIVNVTGPVTVSGLVTASTGIDVSSGGNNLRVLGGNFSQAGGTFSLAGNAASSITTSTGNITITAAAKLDLNGVTADLISSGLLTITGGTGSLWSTSGGTLTVQAATTLTIRGGGPSASSIALTTADISIKSTADADSVFIGGVTNMIEITQNAINVVPTTDFTFTGPTGALNALALVKGASGDSVTIDGVAVETHAHAGGASGVAVSWTNISSIPGGHIQLQISSFLVGDDNGDVWDLITDVTGPDAYIEVSSVITSSSPILKVNANSNLFWGIGFIVPADAKAGSQLDLHYRARLEVGHGTAINRQVAVGRQDVEEGGFTARTALDPTDSTTFAERTLIDIGTGSPGAYKFLRFKKINTSGQNLHFSAFWIEYERV